MNTPKPHPPKEDDVLRRMLMTPPDPKRAKQPTKQPAKKAPAKKAAKASK